MTVWPYIAGFIDGEGCIEFTHGGRYARISVSQAYPEVLDFLVDGGLGHIYTDLVRYESGYKRRFRWRVQAREDVKFLLEGIEPFLILKKKQAQLALRVIGEGRPATLAEVELMKKLKRPHRASRHVVIP